MKKILIIEDDVVLAETLGDFFELNGLKVFRAATGQQGIKAFAAEKPNLVLLDVMLPDISGFEVIAKINTLNSSTPVIFMTGSEFDTESQIKAYKLRALNYIPKPVIPAVLLAMIQRLIPQDCALEKTILNYQICLRKQQVSINNFEILLREKDAELLRYLVENHGRLVSRIDLMEYLWQELSSKRNNQLDGAIARLKKSIEPFDGIQIKTIYGAGYLFQVD